jgi:hypothetical protein
MTATLVSGEEIEFPVFLKGAPVSPKLPDGLYRLTSHPDDMRDETHYASFELRGGVIVKIIEQPIKR